jgi:hypothetical protein
LKPTEVVPPTELVKLDQKEVRLVVLRSEKILEVVDLYGTSYLFNIYTDR